MDTNLNNRNFEGTSRRRFRPEFRETFVLFTGVVKTSPAFRNRVYTTRAPVGIEFGNVVVCTGTPRAPTPLPENAAKQRRWRADVRTLGEGRDDGWPTVVCPGG